MSRKQIIFRAIICVIFILIFILPVSDTIAHTDRTVGTMIFLAGTSVILGYILYIYLMTSRMMKILDVSTEEEFRELKRSCPVKHNNRFFLSEDWVINAYSLKAYPTESITDVAVSDSYAGRAPSRHYINISYAGGTDRFRLSLTSDRNFLANAIREYSVNRKKSWEDDDDTADHKFIPDLSNGKLRNISRSEAEKLFNEAIKKQLDKK